MKIILVWRLFFTGVVFKNDTAFKIAKKNDVKALTCTHIHQLSYQMLYQMIII